jgi:hypothetical protein
MFVHILVLNLKDDEEHACMLNFIHTHGYIDITDNRQTANSLTCSTCTRASVLSPASHPCVLCICCTAGPASHPCLYYICYTAGPISWRSVVDLADMVQRKDVTSVVIDMNGSMGYLKLLSSLAPSLGSKLKARRQSARACCALIT